MSQPKPYLFIEEIAELLSVHPETVRVWIRAGRLHAVKIPGARRWLILRTDLDAFLQGTIEPTG